MPTPDEISDQLLADFDPKDIELKDGQRFIGHERIRLRLIQATGNQFDWCIDKVEYRDDGAIRERQDKRTGAVHTPLTCVVYGTLTIPGLGSRSDTGVQVIQHGSGEDSAYKGAVSDALKRCAMNFGVGLRQLYIGENVESSSRATTQPKPVNQKPVTPANERRQLSDKEFDEEVRKALATKDSQQMLLLVEEAQDFTGRWIILAQNALSLQSLDWLERKAQAMGITSPAVANAFRKRREVIESGAEQELFR
jgi:hypothetical protein